MRQPHKDILSDGERHASRYCVPSWASMRPELSVLRTLIAASTRTTLRSLLVFKEGAAAAATNDLRGILLGLAVESPGRQHRRPRRRRHHTESEHRTPADRPPGEEADRNGADNGTARRFSRPCPRRGSFAGKAYPSASGAVSILSVSG
jgi:hypothetical protein